MLIWNDCLKENLQYMSLCVSLTIDFMVMFFSYTLVEPPDSLWGSVDEHGIGSGLVGQLQRRVS